MDEKSLGERNYCCMRLAGELQVDNDDSLFGSGLEITGSWPHAGFNSRIETRRKKVLALIFKIKAMMCRGTK